MSNLSRLARQRMEELHAFTAQAFDSKVGATYTATPTVAQSLQEKITEAGDPFLKLINAAVPVKQLQGKKILMDVNAPVSSRTDTSVPANERKARWVGSLDDKGYQLYKVNSDIGIPYEKIDVWAEFPDFADRYANLVRKTIADDRVRCGFHGTHVAANSDSAANPNLEDVNIGWLQLVRNWNGGSQHLAGTDADPIVLGGTHAGLDVLVLDARQGIDVVFRNATDLVALVSSDILAWEEQRYYIEYGRRPTEKKELLNNSILTNFYGGLRTFTPPFFPDRTVFITSLTNLSIYWQSDSWRRKQEDNAKKDQYEDFNSRNEGYVVEEERKTYLVENITLSEASAAPAGA